MKKQVILFTRTGRRELVKMMKELSTKCSIITTSQGFINTRTTKPLSDSETLVRFTLAAASKALSIHLERKPRSKRTKR